MRKIKAETQKTKIQTKALQIVAQRGASQSS